MTRLFLTGLAASLAAACSPEAAEISGRVAPTEAAGAEERLRVATFNVSLYRDEAGALARELAAEPTEQLEALRAIIRQADPDILVLNEFDYEASGEALGAFAGYLDLGYQYRLALPSNTGVASGADLDGDGRADHPPGTREYGNDAFGYGVFPGQYAMAVLSRHPIDAEAVRTFRQFLWKDLPGNLMPLGYYDDAAREVFRLSSKTHADVPVLVGGEPLHLVLTHPTPPGFDGPEDRNGRRNYDEIRLVTDYVTRPDAEWLRDDRGRSGGLSSDAHFVIAGDLNADPVDSEIPAGQDRHAITALLDHPRTRDPRPASAGATLAAERQGEANVLQSGDPALDTADFSDGRIGNLRVDYLIPSSNLSIMGSGVFWPAEGDAAYRLVGSGYPPVSSDHRLVWLDLAWPPQK